MQTIGLVILGAGGYMAEDNALSCLPQVRKTLHDLGVHVEVIIAADPDFYNTRKPDVALTKRKRMREYLFRMNPFSLELNADLAIFEIMEDYLEPVQKFPKKIIFYDASPTNKHHQNLSRILNCENDNFFYFGEKPIFTDPVNLYGIEGIASTLPIFCDFIETSNPAVEAVSQYILENDLRVTDLKFWRAGSSGIKHIIGHEQQGVQGGAILDKAVHDLAITMKLLGATRVRNIEISESEILSLVPKINLDSGDIEILNCLNRFDPVSKLNFDIRSDKRGSRHNLPADGMSSMKIDWTLDNGDVISSEYLFSWIGCTGWKENDWLFEQESLFVDLLENMKYTRENWLMQAVHKSNKAPLACSETQCRVMIVEANDRFGNCYKIFSNLIMVEPKDDDSSVKLERWAKIHVIKTNGETEEFDLDVENAATYREQKRNDLTSVFCSVIGNCAEIDRAESVGPLATYLVHRAMLEARDIGIERAGRRHSAGEFDHSLIGEYISQCIFPSR